MAREMTEELGIIRGIHLSWEESREPSLWFTIDMLYTLTTHAVMGQDALDFLRKAGVINISEIESKIEGKRCVMEGDTLTAKFIRLL